MGKQIVNFEEARMLCEFGFKDDVERVYDSSDKEAGLLNYGESVCGDDALYAPTYKQAFKWLVANTTITTIDLIEVERKLQQGEITAAFIAYRSMRT
jgi:hypothetical protein